MTAIGCWPFTMARVRLISRSGVDWTCAFPMIVAAVEALPVRNCLIDGEVIMCDGNGVADFQLLRWRHYADPAILCAFDLLGLDGLDVRCEPIEQRKAELARLLADCRPAVALNRVFDDPGPTVFEHACSLGCAGIVSKRRGSQYAAGRSPDWLKVKNRARVVHSGQEVRTAVGQMSTLLFRRTLGEGNADDYSVIHEGHRVGRVYRMQSTDTTEIGARAPHARSSGDGSQRLECTGEPRSGTRTRLRQQKQERAVADYYPLVARAATDLETSTAEARRALYDRTRSVQAAQLGKFDPPLSESHLSRERQALEKAIQMVEALASAKEYAVSDATIVADYASFIQKTKIPIDCFYDTNLLPHPKQAIIAAIERQIVQESSDARVEWLRAAPTFLWNFLEGVDAAPVPVMAVDLDRLRRDAAPELVVQQIVSQFCAIEDERNESFRAMAKREDKQIEARITAATDMRNELLIRERCPAPAMPPPKAEDWGAMNGPGEETIEHSKELIREIEELLARAALKQRTLTRRAPSGSG
jgi:bifunctional non-homologous end joining protein LigD